MHALCVLTRIPAWMHSVAREAGAHVIVGGLRATLGLGCDSLQAKRACLLDGVLPRLVCKRRTVASTPCLVASACTQSRMRNEPIQAGTLKGRRASASLALRSTVVCREFAASNGTDDISLSPFHRPKIR